jgi:hypothetical protein
MRFVDYPFCQLERDWVRLPSSISKLHINEFFSREFFAPWFCNVLTSNAFQELKIEACSMYPNTFANLARGDISLTHLEFLECQFYDPPGVIRSFLNKGRRRFPNLVSLEFNKCRLGGNEVLALCSANFPNLQRLSLPNNLINIAGALALIESIASRPVLREVNLSNNYLEYPRLQMIAEELQAFPNVLCIDLSSCIHWPHGRGHHMDYTERLPEMDSKESMEIARQEAAKAFLAAAKANRNIHHLNIRGNDFPLEIETEIQFHVGVHESFRDLLTSAGPASLATGAWSFVLARIQGRHDASVVPSLLYYILQERHDDLVPNQR